MHPVEFGTLAASHNLMEIAEVCRREADVCTGRDEVNAFLESDSLKVDTTLVLTRRLFGCSLMDPPPNRPWMNDGCYLVPS
jgi:hypothetical protein